MGLIVDTLLLHLPTKRKTTPSGWISFNAVCCDDKRQRGGFIVNGGEGVSYHCFNCGFKTSWQPGRTLSQKMRKFMRDLNINDDTISKLSLEALRQKSDVDSGTTEIKSIIPKFDTRALPMEAKSFEAWDTWLKVTGNELAPQGLVNAVTYLSDRKIHPLEYPFYYSNKVGFTNRLIIPFMYQNEIVGWTARAMNDAKPKYISEQQPGYVFNLDNQVNRQFTIVCEGPFDAISIDGCALLGAEISEGQNYLLKQLGTEIVFVPDRDHEGPRSVEQAIDFGWSVSMPEWPEGVKDVNDALVKLGKLATLWLILDAKESYALKIQLRAKKWFKEVNDTLGN
jgi:hypothetical protein